MDVSHTDHSHIIGKGGGNIKRGTFQQCYNCLTILALNVTCTHVAIYIATESREQAPFLEQKSQTRSFLRDRMMLPSVNTYSTN